MQSLVQTSFNLEEVQRVYNTYETLTNAGVTLVMGHPFEDENFQSQVLACQSAIKKVFRDHELEECLNLYEFNQIHSTLIELASQHTKNKGVKRLLETDELTYCEATKRELNLNYTLKWIKKTAPFDVEFGSNVLPSDDLCLKINNAGQIIMKGRSKERGYLSKLRSNLEEKGGMRHKYGCDDGFFFVIGYLKPNPHLNDEPFLQHLEECLQIQRASLQFILRIETVKIILFDKYTLANSACIWESKPLSLLHEIRFSNEKLLQTLIKVNDEAQKKINNAH